MKVFRASLTLFLLIFGFLAITGCTREAKRDRYLAKAEEYLAAKKYQSAELEALNAMRFDSRNLKGLSILQTVYYDQGRILKLIPVLQTIETLDTNNITVQLRMARILMELNDTEKARQRARAVLGRDKTNLESVLILAESATTPEEAQEVQRLIDQWPKTASADYHLIKATLHMRRQDLAATEAELLEALKVNGKSVAAQQFLAWVAWTRGDLKRADDLFKSASDLAAGQPFEQIHRAVFKMRIGELEEARKVLESIVGQHPDYLPAQSHLATIAMDQKRYDDCEKIVGKILAQDRSMYKPLELHARLKMIRGATEAGAKELERLSETFQRVPQVHYYVALAHLQKRDISNSRLSLEKAVALDPNFAEAVVQLADLDTRMGKGGKP